MQCTNHRRLLTMDYGGMDGFTIFDVFNSVDFFKLKLQFLLML